ncbi:MAG: hypothetical protein FJ033_07655 [Chloroflexi bacterium]|nr:hypothetical protein [Chloroflexota bacterium]
MRSFLDDLPERFRAFNAVDPAWVAALPDLLAGLAKDWDLAIGPYYPNIWINYVAPATRVLPGGGREGGVLKVSRYLDETANEIAALRRWEGDGAARLLRVDETRGAMLLERIDPGTMLVDLAESDDDEATHITAGLLRRLWRPLDPTDLRGLRPLADWCAAYDRNRPALIAGTGGFPADLFARADALRAALLETTDAHHVLHGDMHHFNVLRDCRRGWTAIDPKGLAGDRHFDICQFMRNPSDRTTLEMNRHRLDIFCVELGLDRARARDWCFVHAMLDACWEHEDAPTAENWRPRVAFAEQMLRL